MIRHMVALEKTKVAPVYISRCKRSRLLSSMTPRWEYVTCKLCKRHEPQLGSQK